MELRSRVFQLALAAVTGLVCITGTQTESDATSYLCTSAPSACEYAPSTAPLLNSYVCWDRSTAVLMEGECPEDSWAYWVGAGEVVDPVTKEVQPYIPLDDACDLGYCVPYNPNDPPGEEGAMCCEVSSGECTPTDSICPSTQISVWCPDGKVPVQSEDDWVCQEPE